ncbi:hypothetical protein GALMADRAFT_160961 [Galerina marginata CBS 339.88]|uniref:Nephrocystin 3-like N-terminal domain-containing protein n=1 Tax=Galerina marginata (strain CBS 339.88) TaxID=685588 RepID=A0A067SCI6_GALM3|nr:hypothetical protein GALMADRAFT_160961 [Galerina marginata CBS 339.88]
MFSRSHQVTVSGGNFLAVEGDYNLSVRVEKRRGIDILFEGIAQGALHNSGERFDAPKCHPNTRTALLQKIMDWIQNDDPSSPKFMWIYGPAGSGKSAIAQSIAELCYEYGFLLGTFFFSRSAAGRNDDKRLAATIAYQIGQSFTEAMPIIEKSVERNPALLFLNLEAQLKGLIIEPLSMTALHAHPRPRLIIIDGLDECRDHSAQTAIIRTFTQLITVHKLPFRILFASRTEYHIREAFNDKIFDTSLCRIALDNSLWRADDDIREFLISRFQKIRDTHQMKSYLPQVWPQPEVIDKLVVKSSGQFIYASTAIKYVEAHGYHPTNRLDTVLGLRSIENGTPFAELDDLYRHILSTVEDYSLVSRILGYLLLAENTSNSPSFLDGFFSFQKGTTYLALSNLHAIINLPDDKGDITISHASFGDFLFDPSRSGIYFLDVGFVHTDLAVCCFQNIAETDWRTNIYRHSVGALITHCSRARVTIKLVECLSIFDVALWTEFAATINFTLFLPRYCALLSNLGAQKLLKRHIEKGAVETGLCYIVLGGKRPLAVCSTLVDERLDLPESYFLDSITIWHCYWLWQNHDCINFLRQFFYNVDRAGEYAMSDDSHLCVALYLLGKFPSKFLEPSFHSTSLDFPMFVPMDVLAALLDAPLSNELFSRVSSILCELDFCNAEWKPKAQNLLTDYLKRCKDDPSFWVSMSVLS